MALEKLLRWWHDKRAKELRFISWEYELDSYASNLRIADIARLQELSEKAHTCAQYHWEKARKYGSAQIVN